MESYPRQCRSADGQLFVEDVVTTVEVSTAVVEPEDPQQIGLAPYPDEPLTAIPTEPISVKELVEHRSALNGQTVRVRGVVVHGDARGRELGFPTANLAVSPNLLVPAHGIYAGAALIGDLLFEHGQFRRRCGLSKAGAVPDSVIPV
ncbi:MAG: hypothetical protein HGA24_07710 [Candidatus Aminicenantes bacterium]|nr:hypothetical protein [Candidatus Aminicenantes bacterium]